VGHCHHPRERYAADDYMYQCSEVQGLRRYLADDAPPANTEIVVWCTVDAHHVVRPQDWSGMRCAYVRVHLESAAFFGRQTRPGPAASPPAARHHH